MIRTTRFVAIGDKVRRKNNCCRERPGRIRWVRPRVKSSAPHLAMPC